MILVLIRLSIILKSNLPDKIKRDFFQAMAVSIQLYGYTNKTLEKYKEKMLETVYTKILRVLLNKSKKQHPTKQQLYGHLQHISQTTKVKRTKYAWYCRGTKEELISDVL